MREDGSFGHTLLLPIVLETGQVVLLVDINCSGVYILTFLDRVEVLWKMGVQVFGTLVIVTGMK